MEIERNHIEDQESNYSYTSRKFWCSSCQRGFSALRLDDTDVHCPRCDNIAIEFINQNTDINRINHNSTQNSNSSINNNQPSSSASSASQRRQEASENTAQQNEQRHPRRIRRTPVLQRTLFGAPTGHFLYVETFPFGGSSEPVQEEPEGFSFGDLFGLNFGIAPQNNSNNQNNNSNNNGGLFGNFFSNLFQGFNPFFGQVGGNQTNEEYERLVEEFLRNDPNKYGPPPAPKETISQLKEEEFNPNEGEKTCAVCQDDFKEGEKVLKLPCKHDYHRECVTKWLTMHNSCPVCREPLKEGCQGH